MRNLTGLQFKERAPTPNPGERFGLLTVIKEVAKCSSLGRMVRCKCDCGEIVDKQLRGLRSGNVKSCGCLRVKNAYRMGIKHGYSTTHAALCLVLKGMKNRCYNPKCKAFKNYGARGIKVCEEWRTDSKIFIEWALAKGWTSKLTIERVDSDGNYEPSNCIFVTKSENSKQMHQKKRFKKISDFVVGCLSLPG